MSKWTPEQEQQLKEMYNGQTPASVIAKLLGITKRQVYDKAYRMGLSDVQNKQALSVKRTPQNRYEAAYRSGERRREKGRTKDAPAMYDSVQRAYWLAGWHDKDMELGNSVIAGRAA